jgi:hypothetical protein
VGDAQAWNPAPMKLEQRGTYHGELPWRETPRLWLDYHVAAEFEAGGVRKTLTSPPEAPPRFHAATLVWTGELFGCSTRLCRRSALSTFPQGF